MRSRTAAVALWGAPMPKHFVNLDALIVREDLEVTADSPETPGGVVSNFAVEQLREGQSMFGVLRKPDFQRETVNWTPEQVVGLIKNFLDEELVPAIILWKARNRNVFVIDGAHRLSALIAWVNDDYGDKQISQAFFGNDNIPKEQRMAATATHDLIAKEVGSYHLLRAFIKKPEGATETQLRRARNIASVQIITQSVTNDAAHAEASFYRINQGGAIIDDSEKEIIRARERPEALAARALLRAGTGHKYWRRFPEETQKKIESTAKDIYDLLYKPELQDPIRTLDLPMAGRGYSGNSLSVLFEFVHIANSLTREQKKGRKKDAFEPMPKDDAKKDPDGLKTLEYLNVLKDVSELITSKKNQSLGLHPAVYSYSATGKFQPTAFFAQVSLVMRLQKENGFFEFTKHRARFEDFLVKYKYFVNQLIGGHGAMTRGLSPLIKLQTKILTGVVEGKTDDEIKNAILIDPEFSEHLREVVPATSSTRKKFSSGTKAAIRVKTALDSAEKCPICHCRLHASGYHDDHKERQQDGGSGNMENGQETHPYCNTGYKERLSSEARNQQP
jgi:hypothetical protein